MIIGTGKQVKIGCMGKRMIYDCFVNPSINTMMVHECNSIYDKLKNLDDFMFGAVLTTHLDICQELLELILNVKIKKVKACAVAEINKKSCVSQRESGLMYIWTMTLTLYMTLKCRQR